MIGYYNSQSALKDHSQLLIPAYQQIPFHRIKTEEEIQKCKKKRLKHCLQPTSHNFNRYYPRKQVLVASCSNLKTASN